MERIAVQIGEDDWLHETWEHQGKTYQTMIPPRLSGDSENPQKDWDGVASLRMAETMAGTWRTIKTLGESDGEPYDPRIEDR